MQSLRTILITVRKSFNNLTAKVMTSGENVTELLTKQKNLIPLNIDQFCPNTNNE